MSRIKADESRLLKIRNDEQKILKDLRSETSKTNEENIKVLESLVKQQELQQQRLSKLEDDANEGGFNR